jgi:modulator of FtsH protease
MVPLSPYTQSAGVRGSSLAASIPYLRRVYGFFTGGVAFATAGACLALYAGEPVLAGRGESIAMPPLVYFAQAHPIVMLLVYFGAFFAASRARNVPGVNAAALFGFTFVTGLFLAPALFIAQLMASSGATLDPAPVRDAFLLTMASFTGLSGYVLVTRKDFSFLGAALSMGLWVVLGAMLLNFFFHAAAFQLAIASVGVLLFCGYILYDTSRLLRDEDRSDAVGAALRLFLDVLNLFVFLLQILSSSSRSER